MKVDHPHIEVTEKRYSLDEIKEKLSTLTRYLLEVEDMNEAIDGDYVEFSDVVELFNP